MPRVQVRLTDKELRILSALAKATGKSESEALREVVRGFADQCLNGTARMPVRRPATRNPQAALYRTA